MHVQDAIPARPVFVINEPEPAELVHDETGARADGTDHLGQRSPLILAMTISGSRSVPKWANNSSGRAGRCSLATAHAPTAYPWHCWIQVAR